MRVFGTEISGNRGRNCELKPTDRSAIVAKRNAGVSREAVAREFGVSPSTVTRTVKRWTQNGVFTSRPRSGRPEKLTRAQKRYIIRLVQRNARLAWKTLISESGTGIHPNTARKAMGRHYRRKWRARKRIQLTKAHAEERLSFARYWRKFEADLVAGTFSDECTVQNAPNSAGDWIFRRPTEKYDRDKVNLEVHVKPTIVVMVWGAIWKGGRSPLVIMERDAESKGNGYSAKSYVQVLEEYMEDYRPGTFFQQDNARIHTAKTVKSWFEEHGIWVIDWPPHSPDLNPIEHVWKKMKEILRKRHPNLHLLTNNKANLEVAVAALKEAWAEVPQSLIDKLIDSTPRRLKTLRRARGWYTKY